jgi:hypothetical protein
MIFIHNNSAAQDKWFLSVYGGQVSDTAFNEVIRFNTKFEDYYLAAFALGKEIGCYRDTINFEVEGQIVKHLKGKEHEEFNAVFILRWLPFPWDEYIDSSIAFGNGISYATRDPEFEINEADDNITTQTQYYLMLELAFALPKLSVWSIFVRVHHRSSLFGLIDGAFAGSNYVCMGVRYSF